MIADLAGGVYDALRGALYLVRHPRLWVYVLLPAIAAGVLLVLAIGSTITALGGPIDALAAHLPGAWADTLLRVVAGVVLAIASLAIFLSVASIIAGPFNEMLSESVEERVTGHAPPPFRVTRFVRELVTGIGHAIRRVVVYVVVMLALLVCGIAVPVVGSAVAAVLGALATARFASYDAYDAVWSRQHLRYRDKVAFMRTHRWRTLGLGAIVGALAIIPGLNVVGLAIGATGATLRSLDLADRERVRATRS